MWYSRTRVHAAQRGSATPAGARAGPGRTKQSARPSVPQGIESRGLQLDTGPWPSESVQNLSFISTVRTGDSLTPGRCSEWSMGKHYLSKRDERRHQRISYLGAARIFWEDERGLGKYGHVKCLDVSEEGLRIEVLEPIPVGSRLSLRSEGINLSTSATVRYIASRRGYKHILGLNLSQPLEKQSLDLAALLSSTD
jgi:hypothetical protein